MNDHFSEVKSILDKYRINRFWNLSNKYYNAYINKICGDYLYENSEAFKNSKLSWVRSFFWHTLFILFGAFISLIKSLKYKSPSGIVNKEARIIVCPFCGRYAWFKHLPYLIKKHIRIVYHPIFHFDYFNKNAQAYDCQLATPEFYRFRILDIFNAFYLLVVYYNRLSHCSKELDNIFGIYKGKFTRIFVFPIIYGGFLKSFVKKNKLGDERVVWIFDYDYDYKYIVFNNLIHQLRNNDITIHIQHGSFVDFNPAYCNPVSDYSFCCSNREQKIIMRANEFDSNIRVLGAPLQTFDDNLLNNVLEKSWDILCLLTEADDLGYDPMKKVLQQLDSDRFKIRVRYRPASKETDKKLLKPFVCGMEESVGKTLLEDVLMSKLVICFSEDALYTAIRNNNPTVYIRDENIVDHYDMSVIPSFFYIENSDKISRIPISDLVSNYGDCHYEKDLFVLNNFGRFRLEDIGEQLNNYLSQIVQ